MCLYVDVMLNIQNVVRDYVGLIKLQTHDFTGLRKLPKISSTGYGSPLAD